MKFTYLLIDLFCIAVPFIFSFHPKLQFYKRWPAFLPACLLTSFFFIAWDILFTYQRVWGFNSRYVSGISFWLVPIEEILFFICIPYACVFTYTCLGILIKKDYFVSYHKIISYSLIALLIPVAAISYDKIYTFVTFILLAFVIFLFRNQKFIARFYFTYLIILIPFIIVNGILTGMWIDEEVVWYNNNENLGIRLFTIPVEDIFYGMLLILLNVSGMEWLSRKKGHAI